MTCRFLCPLCGGPDFDLRKRFRFFLEHAGYCTPPGRAACALNLARAEREAEERGWQYEWEDDADAGAMWAHDGEKFDECLSCLLRDADGNALTSLGGILDPGRDYARVVEAELASEALGEEAERARRDAEATRYMAL